MDDCAENVYLANCTVCNKLHHIRSYQTAQKGDSLRFNPAPTGHCPRCIAKGNLTVVEKMQPRARAKTRTAWRRNY